MHYSHVRFILKTKKKKGIQFVFKKIRQERARTMEALEKKRLKYEQQENIKTPPRVEKQQNAREAP